MLAKQRAISNTVTSAQIVAAKAALDIARQSGDALKSDLAEAVLNDLLDRYHRYHVSQRRKK